MRRIDICDRPHRIIMVDTKSTSLVSIMKALLLALLLVGYGGLWPIESTMSMNQLPHPLRHIIVDVHAMHHQKKDFFHLEKSHRWTHRGVSGRFRDICVQSRFVKVVQVAQRKSLY